MSIKKSFNGKTIRKPGAYSRSKTDNSAGAPLRATDVVFIVGESSKGAPGSVTGIVEFSSDRLSDLVEIYGEGPLVDCAVAAARPSKQRGVGGASIIKVYKTNQSGQASAPLKKGSDTIYTAKDIAYGVEGNDQAVVVAAGSSVRQKTLSVSKIGDTTETLGENAGLACMTIEYTGDGSACTMAIGGASIDQLTLSTSITGQTDGSANLSILLKNYTIKTLVDYINSQTGYSAALVHVPYSSKKANELDPQAAASITSSTSVYRNQMEILDVLNTSSRIEAVRASVPVNGLIDNGTFFLTGGSKGASTNSNFSTGFSNSLSEDYNVLVPAASRDASEDIADSVQGFTDSSSTYTISSVLSAAETHLRLRGDTKNRKEAMGFGGVRKSAKADAFALISSLGSELMQVCMQDALINGADGENRYMHPHVVAALAAGMRSGMAVGEPLTHKFPNVLQVGHMINPETGLSSGDFNPGLDYDSAIDNGVLFLEKASGGFRWVVDNTTYGQDDSFIFNRGSVMAASQYIDKTLRETAELAFVGKKIGKGAAQSIKESVRNKLRELNAPEVNITTSSDDAPEGYVEETFVVTIVGNTARVQVEYKPVQGLDFVFFDFTIGDIKQTA